MFGHPQTKPPRARAFQLAPDAAAATLVDRVRSFVDAELAGKAAYFDRLPAAPLPESRRWHDAGLANWWLPPSHGGAGISLEDSIDLVSELAYGDAGFALGSFPSIIGTTMLQLFAPDVLARPWLESLAREGGFCAVCAAEDEAGSELVRTSTTYRRTGDRVVVSGDKQFSTNADAASVLVVLARSCDGDGLSAIVIPRDTPGIEILKRWDMVGVRGAATYPLRFIDCSVPATHVLPGNGVRNLEVGLNASRILIAATAIGLSRRVRDLALDYALTKSVKGKSLAENAVFAAKLGQVEMLIDIMRNQCRAAASEFDALMRAPDAAMLAYRTGALRAALAAKMFCGQAGWQVATIGSELFGGLGYTNEHAIGKLVRDLRYVGLVEGGDDVIRDLLYSRFVVSPVRRR